MVCDGRAGLRNVMGLDTVLRSSCHASSEGPGGTSSSLIGVNIHKP